MWLPPISDMRLRDQTYSALLQGAELGSRVDISLSHGSERPELGAMDGGKEYLTRFLLSPLSPSCHLAFISLQGWGWAVWGRGTALRTGSYLT